MLSGGVGWRWLNVVIPRYLCRVARVGSGHRLGSNPLLQASATSGSSPAYARGGPFNSAAAGYERFCFRSHLTVFHPAARDREARSGFGVEFSVPLVICWCWRERGRPFLGAMSPFSSWTRGPASTANCCHGLQGPGARLIDFEDRGLSRRQTVMEGDSWKYCIRAVQGWMCTKTW
jgi:hypothetical protein